MNRATRLFVNKRSEQEESTYVDKEDGIKTRVEISTEYVDELQYKRDYIMIGNGVRITSLDQVKVMLEVFGNLDKFRINPEFSEAIEAIKLSYYSRPKTKGGREKWRYLLWTSLLLLVLLALISLNLSK